MAQPQLRHIIIPTAIGFGMGFAICYGVELYQFLTTPYFEALYDMSRRQQNLAGWRSIQGNLLGWFTLVGVVFAAVVFVLALLRFLSARRAA